MPSSQELAHAGDNELKEQAAYPAINAALALLQTGTAPLPVATMLTQLIAQFSLPTGPPGRAAGEPYSLPTIRVTMFMQELAAAMNGLAHLMM